MVHITKSVGRMSFADKHDVAAIQTPLANVKVKIGAAQKPVWPGRIDGRNSKDLESAITIFQLAKNIKQSGKIESFGPTINALKRALPGNMVGLRGLAGTTAVFIATAAESEADQEARATVAKAPFPKLEAKALGELIKAVGKKLGLCLERKREFITNDGRFAVEMDFAGVRWFENSKGRLLQLGKEPPAVIQAVCRIAGSVPAWEVGSNMNLCFKSKRQVAALKGVGQLTTADIKTLGLSQAPSAEIMKTCAAACARLISTGALETAPGKSDHAVIVEAVKGADVKLAQALQKSPLAGLDGYTKATRGFLEKGIMKLEPRLNDTIAKLRQPDAAMLAIVGKYFKPRPASTLPVAQSLDDAARRILQNLTIARRDLSTPFDDLFMSSRDNRVTPQLRADLGDNLAVANFGRIVTNDKVYGIFSPLQVAGIILHELMHFTLKLGNEDFRYLFQGVEGLIKEIAEGNADSYVAVVFDDILPLVEVPRTRPKSAPSNANN